MRALISVSDKTGIVEFASELNDLGVEIISTGGTAKVIEQAGVPVIKVSDITGFPECLNGRVKTLHPKVHGGILAIRGNEDHMKQLKELEITPIDLVVINLYPFKDTIRKQGVTLQDAIENIDIGGPTMLRSAAKNFDDVTVVIDPSDYDSVLSSLKERGETTRDLRFQLAIKVFEATAHYDTMISDYLNKEVGNSAYGNEITFTYEKVQDLRYGENPHQKAAFYKEIESVPGSLTEAEQLQGKELSYNNINDTNGALEILKEYNGRPTIIAVKHANPCGIGSADTIEEAFSKAYEGDKVSIYGGIIASNRIIDEATAMLMKPIFLEVVLAPGYTEKAMEILKTKKNLRVLKLDEIESFEKGYEVKKVLGGILVQDRDAALYDDLKVVTDREPTEKEMADLLFAWKAVKNTKSNGISLAKDEMLVGNGPGQVSRIWALENAIKQSEGKCKGAVMASDAFFPFDDCVRAAAAAGITAVIQPGGSIRDEDSIKACNELGMAMVTTGMRHFKHS
jgi:phosphoribosylaminoimidazolecarboxamide formyltransferase/IMP cyclohydrolase